MPKGPVMNANHYTTHLLPTMAIYVYPFVTQMAESAQFPASVVAGETFQAGALRLAWDSRFLDTPIRSGSSRSPGMSRITAWRSRPDCWETIVCELQVAIVYRIQLSDIFSLGETWTLAMKHPNNIIWFLVLFLRPPSRTWRRRSPGRCPSRRRGAEGRRRPPWPSSRRSSWRSSPSTPWSRRSKPTWGWWNIKFVGSEWEKLRSFNREGN